MIEDHGWLIIRGDFDYDDGSVQGFTPYFADPSIIRVKFPHLASDRSDSPFIFITFLLSLHHSKWGQLNNFFDEILLILHDNVNVFVGSRCLI